MRRLLRCRTVDDAVLVSKPDLHWGAASFAFGAIELVSCTDACTELYQFDRNNGVRYELSGSADVNNEYTQHA